MNTYLEERQGPTSSSKPASFNSILVADCGTVFTKVSLLGLVEGQYRLMACGEAPTTLAAPFEDITKGIIEAINVIEFITGRHFVSDGRMLSPEKSDGDGVDVFVATVSAGGPLRLMVLGAVGSTLEAFISQALSGLYTEIYVLPAPSYAATSTPAHPSVWPATPATLVGGAATQGDPRVPTPHHSTPAPTGPTPPVGGAATQGDPRVPTPHHSTPAPTGPATLVGGASTQGDPRVSTPYHSTPAPTGPTSSAGQWAPDRIALEWEHQLERFRDLQPHAALIVGMADGPAGPSPLQEASQLLLKAVPELNERQSASTSAGIASTDLPSRPLPVIYAGAPQYSEAVRRMLRGFAEVEGVDALVSQAQLKSVSLAASTLYERDVLGHIGGYEHLRSWSTSTPVATAASLSSLVRFLAHHYTMSVTTVDVGGATTTVMLAGEKGEFAPLVNSGIGVGPGVGAILQQAGLQRLARWLPFEVTEDELRQYVLNRMLHPQVTPTNLRELLIGQAFAREAIILTIDSARYTNLREFRPDLILATGAVFAHAPKHGQAALMLLDALQPCGVTSLVLDRTMLISQLGAVATVLPVAAVQVNENDGVTHRLGSCIAPFGRVQQGQLALRVVLEYADKRQATVDVMGGSIEVIPLPVNQQVSLTLSPAPTVDVGLGPGERARAAEEIDGGLIGLIIDARGRPLTFSTNETERRARVSQWMSALGA